VGRLLDIPALEIGGEEESEFSLLSSLIFFDGRGV
jgi:hypothetical protein